MHLKLLLQFCQVSVGVLNYFTEASFMVYYVDQSALSRLQFLHNCSPLDPEEKL